MPSRWPRPQGTSVSSARTPRPTRSVMRGRESALGGRRDGRARDARAEPGSRRRAAPEPVDDPPEQAVADRHAERAPRWPAPRARADPVQLARAASAACARRGSRRPRRRPASRLRSVPTRQTSPISACRPVASMIRPIRLLTKPWRRARSASRDRLARRAPSEPGAAVAHGALAGRAPARRDHLAGALELRLRRSRRSRPRRCARSRRRGATRWSGCRSQCSMPLRAGLQLAERRPRRSRGRRG